MGWLSSTWSAVWPNLLASVIWAAPAFTAHHLLIRRHLDRRHQELQAVLTSNLREDPCGPSPR